MSQDGNSTPVTDPGAADPASEGSDPGRDKLDSGQRTLAGNPAQSARAPAASRARIAFVYSRTWEIYDEYRTAAWNALYFERKLEIYQNRSVALEAIIAIGTASTGIAGWALWNKAGFAAIWAGYAGVAATLAIVKPILRWDEKIGKFSKLFGDYHRISEQYRRLVNDIAAEQDISDDILKRFSRLSDSTTSVEAVPQGPPKFCKELQTDINNQIPLTKFWHPMKPIP